MSLYLIRVRNWALHILITTLVSVEICSYVDFYFCLWVLLIMSKKKILKL